jgi:hypothetical protein
LCWAIQPPKSFRKRFDPISLSGRKTLIWRRCREGRVRVTRSMSSRVTKVTTNIIKLFLFILRSDKWNTIMCRCHWLISLRY